MLLLFSGGGWSYLNFVQEARISTLESELSEKEAELNRKQQIADQYDTLLEQFENATFYFNNYDKALYTSANEDKVFAFVNSLNRNNSVTNYTFAFVDSTTRGEHGIITMDITGDGYYRQFINFIRKIELSKPLNKIDNVNINPINDLENYGRVNYSFTLESYYDRARLLENPEFTITTSTYRSVYNPFYPLIREDIEPNTQNLTNIEESELLAISADRVFVIDQNGLMQRMRVGDDVYLGELRSIDLRNRTATFVLNKGGIVEQVTLEVNNEL
ncbi:MAG: type 4a pilus biogenesis protein PilO [Balneolaceae bacterium]|nr:type 4a pilus biogenesis protein PilO [Balneolaceae bacterium]